MDLLRTHAPPKRQVKFDSETLGGRVTCSALIGPVRKLKVRLEGVTICYDPSLLTSDGPTGADSCQADSTRYRFLLSLPWTLSVLHDLTRPRCCFYMIPLYIVLEKSMFSCVSFEVQQ